jgi:coenzyme F420-reducing hydrogenase gamma subunit
MPYALFSHAEQVSKAFASKAEVWRHAAESGLVIEVTSGEEDPPRHILDMDYAIRECPPAADDVSDAAGMSEHDIAQLIAACTSRPSAAAAS